MLLIALPCSQKREPGCGSLYGAFGHGPWGSIYMCPLISSSSSFSSVNGMTVNWCGIDVKNIPMGLFSFGLPLSCSYIYGYVSVLDWLILDGDDQLIKGSVDISILAFFCIHFDLAVYINHGCLFLYIWVRFYPALDNNWKVIKVRQH